MAYFVLSSWKDGKDILETLIAERKQKERKKNARKATETKYKESK